jgi:hypothetical protein
MPNSPAFRHKKPSEGEKKHPACLQSDIPAFKKDIGGGGERGTQCTSKLQVVEM